MNSQDIKEITQEIKKKLLQSNENKFILWDTAEAVLRRKFVIMNASAKNLPFTYTTHAQAVIKFQVSEK